MQPEEAVQSVRYAFPFPDYLTDRTESHCTVARTVLRYLPRGGSVLDFGCGPCDKTAVLQLLGYRCSACDDLGDAWHLAEGNREKVTRFARSTGIDFHLLAGDRDLPFGGQRFDMVMMLDVLEHLHDSPRMLLNRLLGLLKPEGLFLATVPNAVNIRKRIWVLAGRTNLPSYESFYWYPGPWRGHVREYVRGDLECIAQFLALEILELRGCDQMVNKIPNGLRTLYSGITRFFPGWKDSWLLVARKPAHWTARPEPTG